MILVITRASKFHRASKNRGSKIPNDRNICITHLQVQVYKYTNSNEINWT